MDSVILSAAKDSVRRGKRSDRPAISFAALRMTPSYVHNYTFYKVFDIIILA